MTFETKLKMLLGDIQNRAINAFSYQRTQAVANRAETFNLEKEFRRAVQSAMVGAFNEATGWEAGSAVELAAKAVEDVNLHDLAAMIRKSY